MKKILITLALLLVSFLTFGQDYVEDMDGFDWIQMDWAARIAYVQGFYAAYSSLAERIVNEGGGYEQITEEDQYFIDEYFYISITIGDMVDRISSFYSGYSNRRYPLYIVLMTIAGKDYWSDTSFDQNSGL